MLHKMNKDGRFGFVNVDQNGNDLGVVEFQQEPHPFATFLITKLSEVVPPEAFEIFMAEYFGKDGEGVHDIN